MSEIKRGDIVYIGPDGILRPYPVANDEEGKSIVMGIAASTSIGDEPIRLLQRGGMHSTPAAEWFVTLDRDQSVILDEDEDD